ncbi:hypothetical protein M501DRAFT_355104 [Patellaria atrata CBS 101060]|uniref:Velvet domain-containing protein n=1 Tax=Patellaria atrata CBS 101060 TaxID=1346257 RepID=A0A9P4SG22_9PEZI|nr:hypothetical protein M501DRAFT_355104 [Patellaria atrata CBS 101060]
MFHSHFPIPASHYNAGELSSEDVELSIRQHPKEALLAVTGKEKFRKPVDPPPILQLKVKPGVDPSQHFLQSPYLFMCCTLWHPEKDEPYKASGSSRSQSLSGGLTSSLHRLKDVNNTDGGFFVFGDVSCKVVGTHRLHFSLYDLRKPRTPSRENYATCLGTITSDKFVVQPAKDFKGLEESTYLSRAFSDQGVRLRLRKEPRAMMGYVFWRFE